MWKVHIAAPPVDGKANEALCIFLSEIFDLPKRAVRIKSGASSRNKIVEIDLNRVAVDIALHSYLEKYDETSR